MKLGIYGGSFDPIHFGHLILAETCREQCHLDQICFVPAARPPHKLGQTLSNNEDRLEMVRLAIAGHPSFFSSDHELERGGVSYTVDTLEHFHSTHPNASLFFLMGADSLEDLPTWREPERICKLAIPVVVQRPGSRTPDFKSLSSCVAPERRLEIEQYRVEMPAIDLSSTDLRQRARNGQSIRYRTTRAVEAYIKEKQLYKGQEPDTSEK